MTEAIRQKASARRVLAVLSGLLVTILALQGLASVKPGGFEANAATTPAPTPTGTSIQFLNPSKKTSLEISDKDDRSAGASKTAYHLVAWTHMAPSGAGVLFKYDPAGDATPEITIGTGSQVGPDTWEFFWDLPDTIAEGTGVLRVILFNSAGSEIARDEETVTVNNKDRPTGENDFRIEDQAETVEITYPTNGGGMGFFGSPDGTYTGVIDVSISAGDTSVTRLEPYYTVDPPGTDPNYVKCGDETTAQSADGLRCTLASGDRPSQVTAVAVVVYDRTQEPIADVRSEDKDTSDGHRVIAYEQDPASVTFNPASDSEDAPNKCNTPPLTATVLDTNGRKVAGANLDVHVQGPSDNLFFDDSGNNSSAHQPPDQGGHSTEPGVDCESTAATPPNVASVQGDHEQLNAPDIKHIESTVAAGTSATTRAAGTDDSGSFRFQLLSQDTGTTQITAFVDEDFNDRFCSAEASGNSAISWGSGSPTVTGVPAEESTCPKPTPGVTGSPTGTATATATATSTVRPTTTATSTATSTGPTTDRTVTMSVDKGRVVAGRQVTFVGQILSGDRTCTDNEFVQIRRRVLGTTNFRNILTTGTDDQGRFTFTRRVTESADYIAVATAHDQCRESSSGEVTVLVKVKLQIIASDTTPDRGDRVRIKSSVVPQHDGTRLILQRKKGKSWVKVDVAKLNRRSRAQFVITANFGSRTFRTFWKSQDAEHESNSSRGLTIRT